MKLKPLQDRLVVRRAESDKTSPSGRILLPDNSQSKQTRGEVLAAGPGRVNAEGVRLEMDVKVGDVVLFTEWAGNEVPGEKDLLIISAQDVLGVFEN